MEKIFQLFIISFTMSLIISCSQKSLQQENTLSENLNQNPVNTVNKLSTVPKEAETASEDTISDATEDTEIGGFDEFDDSEDFSDFEEEIQTNPEDEVYDPFEGYNRAMTEFNDGLFLYLLDPVASGYAYVVPEGGRRGVSNFIENLLYPVRLVNNILQAKFACAGKETARFVINCTIGILGIFDPAEDWFGIEPCVEDFGQTLGFWGVGAGPHFVIPFLGPSNLRDMFSLYPDSFYDPIAQLKPMERQILFRAFKAVNTTSLHLGEYQSLKRDAFDYYLFFRDAYEQNRKKLIEE